MEYLDICDENGMPTGKVISRREAHSRGILHRTAHVWIARRQDGRLQVLLQKRSMAKESYPGCLDTSSAGHIPAGCEPVESALRELKEELGISACPDDLTALGHFAVCFEQMFHGAMFRDNEFINVFLYNKPVEVSNLRIQKEELDSVGWYDFDEVYRLCVMHDPSCCVSVQSLDLLAGAFS